MEADYGVELGALSPALELPWEDPEGRWHYVELRDWPGAGESDWERHLQRQIDEIPEAREFPALRRFLVAVNSPASPWQTAKCGVWADETEPAENLYDAGFTHSSYTDLVLAPGPELRYGLDVHERLAKELVQMLPADQRLEAAAEIVVRRCYFHRSADLQSESDAGYCLTLFLIGYGATPAKAAECLACAMGLAADCLVRVQPR